MNPDVPSRACCSIASLHSDAGINFAVNLVVLGLVVRVALPRMLALNAGDGVYDLAQEYGLPEKHVSEDEVYNSLQADCLNILSVKLCHLCNDNAKRRIPPHSADLRHEMS